MLRALHIPDCTLGGGVQGNGNVFESEDALIPDYECIRARFLAAEHLPVELIQLIVANLDIVGHKDTGAELVGVATEFRDVFETVAGCLAGPEIRAGDIYGIGTAVNGRDADFQISCGRQKLQTVHITSERQ